MFLSPLFAPICAILPDAGLHVYTHYRRLRGNSLFDITVCLALIMAFLLQLDLAVTMIRYRFCVDGYRHRISNKTYWITGTSWIQRLQWPFSQCNGMFHSAFQLIGCLGGWLWSLSVVHRKNLTKPLRDRLIEIHNGHIRNSLTRFTLKILQEFFRSKCMFQKWNTKRNFFMETRIFWSRIFFSVSQKSIYVLICSKFTFPTLFPLLEAHTFQVWTYFQVRFLYYYELQKCF